MSSLTIYFDGGCKPNPGKRYGSFEALLDDELLLRCERLEFGHGTCNEAEFLSLIHALCDCLDELTVRGIQPGHLSLLIVTDSTILRNRLLGNYRKEKTEPEQRMAKFARQCQAMTDLFRSMDVTWEGRESNVARFGH